VRICFFNRSYYPDLGATGQLLTELAEDLVHDYGCKVFVVSGPALIGSDGLRPQGWAPIRRATRNGVEMFRAWGTTLSRQTLAGRATNYMSYFFAACLASFRIPRADIVVSLTDPPVIGLPALLAARRSGAKFVFLCQDVFPEVASLLEGFRSEGLNRMLDRLSRFLVRNADRVVVLGDTMREKLIVGKGAEPQKLTVIHNWADCASIVPGSKQNPFSRAHGLDEAFVCMHSGNAGLAQNLDTLLDAADRLRRYPDLIVAVVGEGVKRPALEARARSEGLSNVRFFPYQPKNGLKDSFASADVFVISLKRGLAGYMVPSKLYGVLAAGRPCVAAVEEACEVASIIKKYDCGLLAEPGDPDDLARKILTLYHDRALASRFGANARQAALEFDRSTQVRAYYELFQELVCRPTPTHASATRS
jgi:colanic acid biosynthesis glycosyl transferase WcaI